MVTSPLIASPRIAEHLRIGCSTGFMESARGDWTTLWQDAAAISTAAAELSALSEPELPSLVAYLNDEPALPFQFLSLHAPSKQLGMDEHRLIEMLDSVSPRVDAIVVHPDTLVDVPAWRQLGRRLAIENMDARKDAGRTVDELAEYFDVLDEARLCFDIAHAWSVDASLNEGAAILDRFGPRLRHLHLSSLDSHEHHVPLTEEHELLFGHLLDRCRDVPWILEAPLRRD